MAHQDDLDRVSYHQDKIADYEREIDGIRRRRWQHYHAGPGESMHCVTGRMLVMAEHSKKMHEGFLVIARSYLA